MLTATKTVPPAHAHNPALIGVARALAHAQVLPTPRALELQDAAQREKVPFLELLAREDRALSARAASALSSVYGLPLVDLEAWGRESLPLSLIDAKRLAADRVVPLALRGARLTLALSDPTRSDVLEGMRFLTQKSVDVVLVEEAQLARVLASITGDGDKEELPGMDDMAADLDALEGSAADEEAAEDAGAAGADDAPVVRFVNGIILSAIRSGASDIHLEPYEKYFRVRLRIDGELVEKAKPPLNLKAPIASRIKVMSNLDISEKRVPQDGRYKMRLSKSRAIDFRVSTLPTVFGEKIVMRILDPASATLGIDALGYEAHQKKALLEAINRPYGMVLVTGPTGSGKTVSLYTCLNILNSPGTNISTAEDPAEINLPGINQVNINDKAGLTFAAALKSFLRQDPDVIMVGEIRDLETAEVSIKAASTGHLVLSTLHTNDAPSTLSRLSQMGVPAFSIASAVNLITAQRLTRKLCTRCRREAQSSPEALVEAGFSDAQAHECGTSWTLFTHSESGCESCNGGYKGRVGIYQVMPVSEEIRRIIMEGGNALDIAAQARREAVSDLRQSGLAKVKQGLTSLEEVLSSTNE